MSDEKQLTAAVLTSGTAPGSLLPGASSALATVTPGSQPPVKWDGDPKKISDQKRVNGKRPRKPKPPKDSRVYKAVMATIALKAQGFKYDEIAEQLGLTKNTVITYIKRANAKGWLNFHSFDDPEDKLEHVLKHKVVENLNTVLDERSEDGSLTNRAVDITTEVAKGTGLLKTHQVVKNDSQVSTAFALKVQVEIPHFRQGEATLPVVRPDCVGGTPAFDAEVIENSDV